MNRKQETLSIFEREQKQQAVISTLKVMEHAGYKIKLTVTD